MKRLMMATKGCVQLATNDTNFDDIWFSVVKTSKEAMAEGVDYCRPVKTNKFFFLAKLEHFDNKMAGRVISCY